MCPRRPGAAAALPALCGALALATALRLPAAWESGNALNHVSGVWLTLADDLARGTLYRPLHAAGEGYGGTRYFPLAFALEAGLVRLGLPILAAGYAASLGAGLLLALGTFLLLRALGVRATRALPFAPLALAGFAGQHALSSARGDLLAVALSALGLAAVARGRRRGTVALPAAAFVLAFAAKPTALTAAAAGAAWLALRGARGAALRLALLVASGAALALASTEALSGGRFLENLRGVAGAGASAATVVRAPLRLAEELAVGDPFGLVLALAGLAAAAALAAPRARGGWARAGAPADAPDPLLPALWLGAAWAGALAVLASPGTGVNHLVELEAASAALLGAAAARGRAAVVARAGAGAAAAAGLVGALALWRADVGSSRLAELRAIARALPPGPVLSEDPLVPLLAGERPYLLDPFAIRLTAAAPELGAPLSAALRRGAFPAVVLFEDLDGPSAEAWYAAGNLGLPLARDIREGYRRAAAFGRYRLYLPRATAAGVVRRDEPS
jgi:hypothetical protein